MMAGVRSLKRMSYEKVQSLIIKMESIIECISNKDIKEYWFDGSLYQHVDFTFFKEDGSLKKKLWVKHFRNVIFPDMWRRFCHVLCMTFDHDVPEYKNCLKAMSKNGKVKKCK